MSIEALKWAFEQEDVPPSPRFVLVALANRADETGYCFPSIKWVRKKTGFADSNVRKYLVDLQAMGKLKKGTRRREDGGRSTNEYQLALDQPGLRLDDTPPPVAGDTPPATGGAPRQLQAGAPPATGGHINKTNHTKKTIRSTAPLLDDLPDFVPREEWLAYVEDRKERRKALTTRATKLALQSLAELHAQGHDLKAVIRAAIIARWSSFHAPKPDRLERGVKGEWERTAEGIAEMAKRIGVERRDGESHSSLRDRVKERLEMRP